MVIVFSQGTEGALIRGRNNYKMKIWNSFIFLLKLKKKLKFVKEESEEQKQSLHLM